MKVVASLSQGRTAAAQFTHKSVPVIFEPPFVLILVRPRLIYAQQIYTVLTLMNNSILFPTATYSQNMKQRNYDAMWCNCPLYFTVALTLCACSPVVWNTLRAITTNTHS